MTSTNTYTDQSYVVYHITYSGDKLPSKNKSLITPSNYIGSTSLEQIQKGYMGSVKSKHYKSIWNQELKNNSHSFTLEIISNHDTRSDATYKELQIQKLFNVVKNPLFVNLAYASVNGYFGKPTTESPTSETRAKISNSLLNRTPEQKAITSKKISDSRLGKPAHNKGKPSPNKGKPGYTKGYKQTSETKAKISKSLVGNSRAKGNVQSDDTKAKRKASHNSRTPEQKALSEAKRQATRALKKLL